MSDGLRDISDDAVQMMLDELCNVESSVFKMTDAQVDMLDAADKYVRNGGKLSKKDRNELYMFYLKYQSRKKHI